MAKVNIDLEKFLLDLIDIAERHTDREVTSSAMIGALKSQGYKIGRNGTLIGIDEVEPEPPKIYLVYDMDNDTFKKVNEKPPLKDMIDVFLKVGKFDGSDYYIRQTDYFAYLARKIALGIND